MPPGNSPTKQRRLRAKNSGITLREDDFAWLCKQKPNRIGIVAEGDSWFAYPRKWILVGKDINILHHIADKVSGTDKVNMIRLASNGDEACQMMAGEQKHKIARILKQNSDAIRFILFSGGGNDLVGKWDMERILKPYKAGYGATDCLHAGRLSRKLKRIELAYQELIELRDDYAPKATIVTHVYDFARPSKDGAIFFWGTIKTKPWIYPYLVERDIPEHLHLDIVVHLLTKLKESLLSVAAKPGNADKIKVVDTQNTLRPGHKDDWLNEIHPTEDGFKKITKKIYAEMKNINGGLP